MIAITVVTAAGNGGLAAPVSLHRENDESSSPAVLPIFEFAPDG